MDPLQGMGNDPEQSNDALYWLLQSLNAQAPAPATPNVADYRTGYAPTVDTFAASGATEPTATSNHPGSRGPDNVTDAFLRQQQPLQALALSMPTPGTQARTAPSNAYAPPWPAATNSSFSNPWPMFQQSTPSQSYTMPPSVPNQDLPSRPDVIDTAQAQRILAEIAARNQPQPQYAFGFPYPQPSPAPDASSSLEQQQQQQYNQVVDPQLLINILLSRGTGVPQTAQTAAPSSPLIASNPPSALEMGTAALRSPPSSMQLPHLSVPNMPQQDLSPRNFTGPPPEAKLPVAMTTANVHHKPILPVLINSEMLPYGMSGSSPALHREERQPTTTHREEKTQSTFPMKLHRLLSKVVEDGNDDIVSWTPSGNGFKVHDRNRFIDEVVPQYFRHKSMPSFRRQLSMYGFVRVTRGPEEGSYQHRLFRRDHSEWAIHILRVSSNKGPST